MATSLTDAEYRYELSHWNDTKRPALIAGSVVLITLDTFAVILRLWSRRVKRIGLAADDYTIIVALVGTASFSSWHLQDSR